MADVTITLANIEETASTVTQKVQCGEAVTGGQAVYLKSADSKYWLAVNSSEEASKIAGIMITPKVATDGYGTMATLVGDLVIGGTLVAGTVYVASSTAGAIHPTDDLATTEWVHAAGVAEDTAILKLGVVSGVQHV